MYTRLIQLLLILCLLFSCKPKSEENEKIPDTVLNEEEMATVLTDAYLAEGAAGINVKAVTGQKFDSAYIFNPLKDNNVDKTKFDSSMAYYTRHPKMLKVIYDKILARLSFMQAQGK